MKRYIHYKGREALVPCNFIGVAYGRWKLFQKSLWDECHMEETTDYRSNDTGASGQVPDKLRLILGKDSGFFFGTTFSSTDLQSVYVGKPIDEDGHIICFGETGRGKGQSQVMPTMKMWTGSQLIFDVKGDLLPHWVLLHAQDGKKVKIFSPSSASSCKYDPYASLRKGDRDSLVENVQALALALIPLQESVRDPIWGESAQTFLSAAHLYYYNLNAEFVDAMATILKTPVTEMIDIVMRSNDDEAKLLINKLSDVPEKVISNIGMEISGLSCLVTNAKLRDVLTVYDDSEVLDWRELSLSSEPVDVILQIPEENLAQWAPMTRLMVNQMVRTLEMRPPRTYDGAELPPILVMLDEFPRLGKVPAIKSGLTTLRSRGVTFAIFAQSMAQIEEVYGSATARVILENCSYKAILGATDAESQRVFAELVGTDKFSQIGTSLSLPIGCGLTVGQIREYIIQPHEFATMDDVILLTPYGMCGVKKTLFFKNKELFTNTVFENRSKSTGT